MGEKQTYSNFRNTRNNIKCPTEVRKLPHLHFSHANLTHLLFYLCNVCIMAWVVGGCNLIVDLPSHVFQEHPFIFTKVNSFPVPTTTTSAPTLHSTARPLTSDCADTVPVWLAAVLAVVGLLIGCVVTWLLFCWRSKRSKKRMTSVVEMQGTGF